jgi:hypothetical protein
MNFNPEKILSKVSDKWLVSIFRLTIRGIRFYPFSDGTLRTGFQGSIIIMRIRSLYERLFIFLGVGMVILLQWNCLRKPCNCPDPNSVTSAGVIYLGMSQPMYQFSGSCILPEESVCIQYKEYMNRDEEDVLCRIRGGSFRVDQSCDRSLLVGVCDIVGSKTEMKVEYGYQVSDWDNLSAKEDCENLRKGRYNEI